MTLLHPECQGKPCPPGTNLKVDPKWADNNFTVSSFSDKKPPRSPDLYYKNGVPKKYKLRLLQGVEL